MHPVPFTSTTLLLKVTPALLLYLISLFPQAPPATPFCLVISNNPNLWASLIVRGPRPCNVVHMVPSNVDLPDFAAEVRALILKADGLAVPGYAGVLHEALLGYQ